MGTSFDRFGNIDKHPLREFLYRVKDPILVFSHALRRLIEVYDAISPSEFSIMYRKIKPITMCSNARLRGLHRAVRHVVEEKIPGDFVECGSAQGGSAAMMGLTLKSLGETDRLLWLFDTFEGLPAPTHDDPDFEIAKLHTGTCYASLDSVIATFQNLDIAGIARFEKGLFQDTLPKSKVDKIAVLHLDGDWYQSVKVCLSALYDRVSPGGIIQIDDYGFWKGAKKAVEEFFVERSIRPTLKRLDYAGRQFIKP